MRHPDTKQKSRPPRQYQAIWQKIKDNPDTRIKIYAPQNMHKRIAKAIRLERYKCVPYWPESYGHTLFITSTNPSYLEAYLRKEAGMSIRESMASGAPLFFTTEGEIYHEPTK